MVHESGRFVVAFNGEIYNHEDIRSELSRGGVSLRTRSDTEVLLCAYAAWGQQCVDRLDGMFAFAVFDRHLRRLFLARDRVGEKPLFFRRTRGSIRFGSELKALLREPEAPRRISTDALDCLLSDGFVAGERTILEGYEKLPPGCFAVYDLESDELRVERYWRLPRLSGEPRLSPDELDKRLEHLLDRAVERQLAADVPVGVLLSGGVDSSVIAALAKRHKPDVRSFCVSFSGSPAHDESAYASRIANYLGTTHLTIEAKPSAVSLLPRLAIQFDEPIIDSSMVPTYCLARAVREHCTVAIGGDGGDELFGGYVHYREVRTISERLSRVPRPLRALAGTVGMALLPPGARGRNLSQASRGHFQSELPLTRVHFDVRLRSELLGGAHWLSRRERRPAFPSSADPTDPVDLAMRSDFERYLAEDILVKVDRASMLTSLEVRSPILSRHVVEFAFGAVPRSEKVNGGELKIILKRLARRLLPRDFNLQRKQGFAIPLADWLRGGPFREFVWGVLTDRSIMFDRRTVSRILAAQDAGYANSERIFALTVLQLWASHYRAST